MAKLYIQEIPENDLLQQKFNQHFPAIDVKSLRTYMLMRKLSTDLDVALDSYFSQYNLSVGRFTLLILLEVSPEGLMPSELAHQVGVTQATISGLINSLEKAGFVQRATHHRDGRAFVIKMTPQGSEFVQKISPDYYARVEAFMNEFNDEEKQLLASFSQRAIAKVSVLGRDQ